MSSHPALSPLVQLVQLAFEQLGTRWASEEAGALAADSPELEVVAVADIELGDQLCGLVEPTLTLNHFQV